MIGKRWAATLASTLIATGAAVGVAAPAHAACAANRIELYSGINYGGTLLACYATTGVRGGISLPPGIRNNVWSIRNTTTSAFLGYDNEICTGSSFFMGDGVDDTSLETPPVVDSWGGRMSSFELSVNAGGSGCGS